MGREIKRVAANFDWPMDKTWPGYLDPYWEYRMECPDCGSHGLCPEAKVISDTFYNLYGPGGRAAGWGYKITQEEVNILADEGRIRQFPTRDRITNDDGKFLRWERVLNDDGTPYYPTAEEVNALESRGMVHDGINKWILVKHRCAKAGMDGDTMLCQTCKGSGDKWISEERKKQSDNFRGDMDPTVGEIYTHPPEGEWWQVWQTVSEGSPVTPAFATADELIDYLVEHGDLWDQKRRAKYPKGDICDGTPPTREEATAFVKGTGWGPSMVISDGKIKDAYEAAVEVAE